MGLRPSSQRDFFPHAVPSGAMTNTSSLIEICRAVRHNEAVHCAVSDELSGTELCCRFPDNRCIRIVSFLTVCRHGGGKDERFAP
jgi:hypothetical protein